MSNTSVFDTKQFSRIRAELLKALHIIGSQPASDKARVQWKSGTGQTVREFCLTTADEALNKPFTVAVVGAFNAGKSSILNVLLGELDPKARGPEGLLPTAAIATTAAVTVLQHSEKLTFEVLLKDGRTREIPPQSGPAFLCSEKVWTRRCPNADVSLVKELLPNVREVRIGVSSPLLKDGIVIVDTPGLGSVEQAHTELTTKYLTECDAALFLMATEPAMGERDLAFLQYAASILNKFLFVQTKRDLGERIENGIPVWRRVQQEHIRRIAEILGSFDDTIHVVSALQAATGIRQQSKALYESGIPALRDTLDRFLASHSGRDRLQKWLNRGFLALQRTRQLLEADSRLLREKLESLEAQVASEEEFEEWQILTDRLRMRFANIRRELDLSLSQATTAAEEAARQGMEKYVLTFDTKRAVTDDDLARLARQMTKRVQLAVRTHLRPHTEGAFDKAVAAALQATEHAKRSTVALYLTNSDPLAVVDALAVESGGSSLITSAQIQVDREGFLNALARTFLGWLFPNIGKEWQEIPVVDRNEVLRKTSETLMHACEAVREQAFRQLDDFTELILDELDAAAHRARAEAEERMRIARASTEECQAALHNVLLQLSELETAEQILERVKSSIAAART